MRKWLLGLTIAALAAAPALAQDAAEAVVKKAIDAHGGADALNKYKAGTAKMKGEMSVFGMDITFTGEMTYFLPDKYKMTIDAEVAGQKLAIVQVANGKKYKQTINNMAIPLKDAERDELLQSAMMQEVSQLTPLLDAKKYTIKAEKDAEVEGKAAAVVLVTAKGFKDTKLSFDKKTGLLVKMERKGLAPSMDDPKEVNEETLLSDYQKVEGVLQPMKVVVHHDGKKFMTMTMSDSKLMEKADEKTFATDD
jgi:hypothetical protein